MKNMTIYEFTSEWSVWKKNISDNLNTAQPPPPPPSPLSRSCVPFSADTTSPPCLHRRDVRSLALFQLAGGSSRLWMSRKTVLQPSTARLRKATRRGCTRCTRCRCFSHSAVSASTAPRTGGGQRVSRTERSRAREESPPSGSLQCTAPNPCLAARVQVCTAVIEIPIFNS